MRSPYFIIAFLMVMLSLCPCCAGIDGKDLFSKGNTQVKPPLSVKYEPPPLTLTQKILSTADKYKPHLIVLLLLVILFTASQIKKTIRSRKMIELNDEEIAMYGHLGEIAGDLWHSIKSRTRAKIIPFTRRN